MTNRIDYREALEDCLGVMRAGGDLHAAVARYPQHADALRDDVRVAYALRRAAATVSPPEGAESRASLRLANALREARAEAQPARRGWSFGWLSGGLRPAAGLAAIALVVVGLGLTGVVSNPLGSPSSVEASVEGVVVENRDGTLTLETPQGLTRVDLNQKPTIQDDALRLLTIADIEAGQVVRVEAKKTPQGQLIAKQVDRKPLNVLKDWCEDNGDACREVAPRLEAVSTQCRPGDMQCMRIQQSVRDVQTGLTQLTKRIQDLKARCEGREAPACRQLMQVCKDHPVVCGDLKIRLPQQQAPGGAQQQQQPPQQRPPRPNVAPRN
jgi:hypothetical protein